MFPFLVVEIKFVATSVTKRSIQRHHCPKAVVSLLKRLTVDPAWRLTVDPAWDNILLCFVLMCVCVYVGGAGSGGQRVPVLCPCLPHRLGIDSGAQTGAGCSANLRA